jgi:hypothetical protein
VTPATCADPVPSAVLYALCCVVMLPMLKRWDQSDQSPTLQQPLVHSLEELKDHVRRWLGKGWEDPGFYVFPDYDKDERLKVDSDDKLWEWYQAKAVFHVYQLTSKNASPPKDKSGLPLTIRTRRDAAERASIAAQVAARYSPPLSSTAVSPSQRSPPLSMLSPLPPKSPSPPSAARVLAFSPPSSPPSPSTSDGTRTPGTKQGDMRTEVLERDSSRCVFTDRILPVDNTVSMPVAHLLPAEPAKRLLHRDFVVWFQTNVEQDKHAKYKDYIVPRVDKGSSKSVDSTHILRRWQVK